MRSRRSGRNLGTSMKTRRRRGSRMQVYDTLPKELRGWLASACLPWSPESALKIWRSANGAHSPGAAISLLNAIESAMLVRDAKIWGGNASQDQ